MTPQHGAVQGNLFLGSGRAAQRSFCRKKTTPRVSGPLIASLARCRRCKNGSRARAIPAPREGNPPSPFPGVPRLREKSRHPVIQGVMDRRRSLRSVRRWNRSHDQLTTADVQTIDLGAMYEQTPNMPSAQNETIAMFRADEIVECPRARAHQCSSISVPAGLGKAPICAALNFLASPGTRVSAPLWDRPTVAGRRQSYVSERHAKCRFVNAGTCPAKITTTTNRSITTMATQTRRKTDDDETTDEYGRHHDSHGRFTSTEGEGGNRGRNGSNSGRSQSNGGRGSSASSRDRDERGRFESDDDQEEDEGGVQGRRASSDRSTQHHGMSEAGGKFSSSQNRIGNRGVISRAVRVLNEIETRLHELREELQDEQGGSSSHSRGGSRASQREDDDDNSSGSRGRLTHPESDRRLKQNRDD